MNILNKRKTYFSGYRPRLICTRLRNSLSYDTKLKKRWLYTFLHYLKRNEVQVLISMVKEAFINGVSTRKIERVAKSMGIENISASQVSQINKGLNQQVEAFRNLTIRFRIPIYL